MPGSSRRSNAYSPVVGYKSQRGLKADGNAQCQHANTLPTEGATQPESVRANLPSGVKKQYELCAIHSASPDAPLPLAAYPQPRTIIVPGESRKGKHPPGRHHHPPVARQDLPVRFRRGKGTHNLSRGSRRVIAAAVCGLRIAPQVRD